MIGTVETILGLPPMSVTDARVARMWKLFSAKPDLRPYDGLTPKVIPFGEQGAPVNGTSAPLARRSARWNFSKEDSAPEIALNRAIWKSIRGARSRMPLPRHNHIIGSRPTDEDEQDG